MSLPEDKHHWDSRKDEVPRKFLDQKETRVEWVTLNDNTDDKENGNGTSDVEDMEL